MTDPNHDDDSARRGALLALAVVVALVVGGWFLYRVLRTESQTEDCMLQGRRNCGEQVQP